MKLTKNQRTARNDAFDLFEVAQVVLKAEIDAINLAQTDLYVRLEAAQNKFNDAADDLMESIHTIGAELSEAIGEKSEKWQESDAGTQAASLAETYENFEVNGFDAEEYVEIEEPENDLEQLQADLPDDASAL